MWERKELKSKAKKVVSKNYWTTVVVCFLIALVTGEFGTSILGVWQSDDSMDPNYILHDNMDKIEIQGHEIKTLISEESMKSVLNETQVKVFEIVEDNLNSALKPQKYIFKIWDAITSFYVEQTKWGILLCIGAVIAFAFTVLVADPLIVGGKKYFLQARKNRNATIGILKEIFQKEHWFHIAMIMFLRNIYTALWYLTIVGGIIKTYEYRMIPYILAENPDINRKEIFALSKQMMRGNKWKTFILDLSFFGWNFLSVLTFGILSILYVNPYNAATMAELYVALKPQAIAEKDEKEK